MHIYVISNNNTKKTILEWDINENDIARIIICYI